MRNLARWVQKPPVGTLIDPTSNLGVGLVECFLLNQGSGNPYESISGAGPIASAALSWVPGLHGPAINFNGTSSYAEFTPYTTSLAAPLTMAAWMKVASGYSSVAYLLTLANITTNEPILTLNCGQNAVGAVSIFFRNNTGAASCQGLSVSSIANDGKWHFLAGTISATGVPNVYLDGNLVTHTQSGSGTVTSGVTVNNAVLGAQIRTSTTYSAVTIESAMMWNRALSAAEIFQLYAQPYGFLRPPGGFTLVPAVAPRYGNPIWFGASF